MESKLSNIQPFTGDRYTVWKFRVQLLLAELDVLTVVDNDLPEEISDEWLKKDAIATSTIVEYLSDSFLGFAKDNATARDIYDNLSAIYERRSLANQLALRKKLLSLKLQTEVTLFEDFSKFDTIITDLLAAGASLDEMDKISHLLLTLPSVYDGIATALETLGENNLTLAFVKTRLLDYEIKLQTEERSTSLKVLNASGSAPTQAMNGSKVLRK